MKALLVIVLLALGGYYGYKTYFSETGSPTVTARLNTIDTTPIPKSEFFQLWTDVALRKCEDPLSTRAIKAEDCQREVNAKSGTCTIKVGRPAPSEIRDHANSQELGKAFLECVTPRPVCRGVEIKSEDEAKRHCR